VTYERYTGNWKGSYMGWRGTPATEGKSMSRSLPGLGNFYLIGQWVEPGGGTPAALISGRGVTQIICKQHKKRFVTSTP